MSGIPENESVPTPPPAPVPPVPAAQPVPPAVGADPGQPAAADPLVPVVPAVAAEPLPPENVLRGSLLSLLAIPAGIIVFVLIWNLGFVSAIVGFGVALAASFLYRFGSGGRVSIRGAVTVTVVTVGTLVLAFLIAMAADISRISGDSLLESLFGPYLVPAIAANGLNALLTIGFGVLGCFTVLRNAFQQARAGAALPSGPVPPAA